MQENLSETNQEQNNHQEFTSTESSVVSSKNNKKPLYIGVLILVTVTVLAYVFLGDQLVDPEILNISDPDDISQQLESSDQSQPTTDSSDLEDEVVEQLDLPPIDDVIEASQDSRLVISSEKQVYQVGESVSMTLLLATATVPDGIQFIINYDQNLLSQVEIQPINSFGSYLTQKVEDGAIKGILLRNPQEEVDVSSSLPLLRITGVAAQAGELKLAFDQEETQVAAQAGQDVLHEFIDLSLSIN
jgi:hypothetical protein